jgi:hypothetical protein
MHEAPLLNNFDKDHPIKKYSLSNEAQADSKTESFEDKLNLEKKEARERFGDLIDKVNKRYENLPENMRADFMIHNEEILDSAIEVGMRNKLSPDEMKMLEMAAIWHDAAKADGVSEEFKDVPNYGLITHGEKAASEIPSLLTDEYLKSKGFSENDFESIRVNVSDAIRQHMGPHPGFMTGMLENANKALRSIGKEEITHPSPSGKVSQALLAADMKSLAGEKGRKKVLAIRANVPFFKNQDEELSRHYKAYGIELSSSEAALLSGFDSAFQARDMIQDQNNRKWVDGAIAESKIVSYEDGNGNEFSWSDAESKRKLYEIVSSFKEAA